MEKKISILIQKYLVSRRETDFELILSIFMPLIKKYAKNYTIWIMKTVFRSYHWNFICLLII